MILTYTQSIHNQTSMSMFPESTSTMSMLQIETQDSLQEVLSALRTQQTPVLLLMPERGDVFNQPEHFMALWQLFVEREQPPLLCFVLPLHCMCQIGLADHYGMQHAPSIEEALQVLAHACLPHPEEETDVYGEEEETSQAASPQEATNTQWNAHSPVTQETISFAQIAPRRFLRLNVGMVVLLLGSIMIVLAVVTPTHALLSPNMDTAITLRGALTFTSSGQINPSMTQGYNDIVTLSLRNIPPPPLGMAYYAWLMPDPSDNVTAPLRLGALHAGLMTILTYAPANHANLLASYSGVRVTLQPGHHAPATPSHDPKTWQWQGFLPHTPAPGDENGYSLLSHLRHLLAKDPTLQANQLSGGLNLWLTQNVSKVEEWASAAQGDWHGMQTSAGDADQLHRLLLRVIEYLDGMFYYQRDVPAGSPWLVAPLAGKIGLLESVPNQQPPTLLAHVDIHVMGLAASPGHTPQQHQLAILMNSVLTRMNRDLQQVRKDTARLVKMNAHQLRQPENQAMLDEMATLTSEVTSGWFDPQTGEDMGGVLWMTSRLQQLANVPVY